MEKSSLTCKNDLDFLNELYFNIDDPTRINSFGKRYNRHKNNQTLFKSQLIPANFPDESTNRLSSLRVRKQPRYIATCKSTTAEFFPEYFCRGKLI